MLVCFFFFFYFTIIYKFVYGEFILCYVVDGLKNFYQNRRSYESSKPVASKLNREKLVELQTELEVSMLWVFVLNKS